MNKQNPSYKARYWKSLPEGIIQCNLCPRFCRIDPGQSGHCFVRKNLNNELILTTYGRSSGFAIDPIEKKPLNHFYPGSPILSFGTAGCNLSCLFCQNWNISKSKDMDALAASATPAKIAQAACDHKIKSVAFTYNDPVIFLEYAVDTARLCHEKGIKTVAVTAGYITKKPREEFFSVMDAANVDLKGFSEEFYKEYTGAKMKFILDTLVYIREKTDVWLELTTLLIPGLNDSNKELGELSQWVFQNLGADTPLHFSAFHPDYKLRDIPPTPVQTLTRARTIAMEAGLKFVYTGNVMDPAGGSTFCPGCNKLLIERNWYEIGQYHIKGTEEEGHCSFCNEPIAGFFEPPPQKSYANPRYIDMRRY